MQSRQDFWRHARRHFRRRHARRRLSEPSAGLATALSVFLESLRKAGGFFIADFSQSEAIMDHWYFSAIRDRREELLAQAAHARILRQLESGRSSKLRGRIADAAQTLSDLLAAFAQAARDRQV